MSNEKSGIVYYPDSSVTDHMDTTGVSLQNLLTAAAVDGVACTFKFLNDESGANTLYHCVTAGTLTIPDYVYLDFEPGAMFDMSSGVTVTPYSPENIKAGKRQRIKTGDGTLAFTVDGEGSPCWFGFSPDATPSDNVTYMSEAIIACSLFIPSGTYEQDEAYEPIPSYRNVRGSGRGKTILKITDYASEGTQATFSAWYTAVDAHDINISDLTMDGNRDNQTWEPIGSANYLLSIRGYDITVTNCEFKENAANGTGTPVSAHDVIFDKIWSHDHGKKGFYSGEAYNIKIINGFYYNSEYDSGIGLTQGVYKCIVLGNHCYNNTTSGIMFGISNATATTDSYAVSITNNHCYLNEGSGITYEDSTSAVTSEDRKCTIANNHCCENEGHGINTAYVSSGIITGNQIYDNDSNGIYAINIRNFQINDNFIANNNQDDGGYSGIEIVNVAGYTNANELGFIDIKDNFIGDTQDTPTQSYGINGNLVSTVFTDDFVVTGNTFDGNVAGPIDWGTDPWDTSLFHCYNNLGYVTEAKGQATILSGTQYIDVEHGLADSPQYMSASGSNSEVTNLRVTVSSGTEFRIYAIDGATSADRVVFWKAEL